MQIRGLYVRGRIDKTTSHKYLAYATYDGVCSKKLFAEYRSAERFLLRLAEKHPEVHTRICKRCGKVFHPRTATDTHYCSDECRYPNKRHKRTVMPIDFILKDMCSDKWPR